MDFGAGAGAPAFNPDDCATPTFYCGDDPAVPPRIPGKDTFYSRHGTPRECLTKGFGAGMYSERAKHLPVDSLQKIKFVGEKYEANFAVEKIKNVDDLGWYVHNHTVSQIDAMLRRVFQKKGGVLDLKAYNATLLYLYKRGEPRIPNCQRM